MEGKLVRRHAGDYKLYVNNEVFAQVISSPWKKLSLKNCQAIENGYDLDELAWKEFPYHEWEYSNGSFGDINEENRETFKIGFKKAVEILGDKKFSEEDILIIRNKFVDILPINDVSTWDMIKACKDFTSWFDNYIQSLQQTEWDCTFNPDEKDADGCLILKRK